jgi:hypothetical protein
MIPYIRIPILRVSLQVYSQFPILTANGTRALGISSLRQLIEQT